MSTSNDKLKRGSGARDASQRLRISARAADRVSYTLPGAVPEEEYSPAAVRQNSILSTSARGPVTGSGVRDDQRRLKISTPSAGHVRFTLPGAVDEEWSPEVSRQNNILSTSAHGFVNDSGARDVRRWSNISTPAARHVRFALPGAIEEEEEEEEWSPAAVRQNIILSTSARRHVTGSSARDVQQRLNISTPAAGQESIAPPGAAEDKERRRAEKKTKRRKKKGICAFFSRKWQAVMNFCCIRQNEDDLDPADPQPGPSGLQSSARKDDWQNSLSGLEPAGCHKPGCCPPGLNTLEKTDLQEEADPEKGPFDQEPGAQCDQTNSQPGPSGLQSRTREHNRQNSLSGLKPTGCHKPGCCPPGLNTLEKTHLQEEADPENGPFDQEPGAQCDQTNSQPGPSGLQSRTREHNRQNSLSGLKPTGCHKPGCCPPGLNTLEKTHLQEEADPENGPFDQEPRAQSDQADPQPGPSGLQSSGHQRSHPARKFKLFYEVGKQIGRGAFGDVYEGTRKSDGRKVAIKMVDKCSLDQYITMPGYAKPLLSEVAINLQLLKPEKSPHVIEMLDWFKGKDQHILVLEFPHPCVTLAKLMIDNDGRLSESLARHLMYQAVLGAKHCIGHNVFHGDIKTDNILVNTEMMELKLIDFGLSNLVKPGGIQGKDHMEQCSAVVKTVYSLGVLLFKMLHGNNPFTPYYKINQSHLSSNVSRECQDFINLCLGRDGVRMPTLENLLDHEWFKRK